MGTSDTAAVVNGLTAVVVAELVGAAVVEVAAGVVVTLDDVHEAVTRRIRTSNGVRNTNFLCTLSPP